MLSKQIGTSTILTMSGTAQVFTATTFAGTVPVKVRIATGSQPAFVSFNAVANTSTSIMIPINTVEHFKLANTSTVAKVNTGYVSVLQAGTAGLISITPVA